MIFVDSGAWFAAVVPTDQDYSEAARWLSTNRQPLITTDYVVDETLTLLKARGQTRRALELGEQFFRGALATIYYITEDDVKAAWEIFRRYTDKEWSFTDCISKVIMDKLGVATAFAFDHHFRQFGTVAVVP